MHKILNSKDLSREVEKSPILLEDPHDLKQLLDFVYVVCNIPGPDTSRKDFHDQIEGCNCTDKENCDEGCECIKRFGPSYDEKRHLAVMGAQTMFQKPIYECNSHCKCNGSCVNRVVQQGIQLQLQVFNTKHKGYGIRTLEGINKNHFVCEYAGEVLDEETAKKRTEMLTLSDNPHFYILALREHLGTGNVLKTYIDPMYVGNAGRFINHSCDPNLYMVPVRIDNNVPHLALFALRDIVAGEELTFDYSGATDDHSSKINDGTDLLKADGGNLKEDKRPPTFRRNINKNKSKVTNLERKKCQCGSEQCKEFLPFDTSLLPVSSTDA